MRLAELARRLIWAWRLKVWPWSGTAGTAAKFIALDQSFSRGEVEQIHKLARKYGWGRHKP